MSTMSKISVGSAAVAFLMYAALVMWITFVSSTTGAPILITGLFATLIAIVAGVLSVRHPMGKLGLSLGGAQVLLIVLAGALFMSSSETFEDPTPVEAANEAAPAHE